MKMAFILQMSALGKEIRGHFDGDRVRSRQSWQRLTESKETVDIRSTVGIFIAVQASDKGSRLEPT